MFTETPNPGELVRYEGKLSAALKEEDSEPLVLQGPGVTWHRAPSYFWVKALERKEKDCVLVYGLPTPNQVAGRATVIDISRMEQSVTSSRTGLEVTANTTVTQLAQHPGLPKELVQMLLGVRTPQWRSATALGDALAVDAEVQVVLQALGAKLVATSCPNDMDLGQGEKTLELEDAMRRIGEFSLRSVIIPTLLSQRHLLFHKVGARKANAAGIICASLCATLEGEVLKDCRLFVGRNGQEEVGGHEGRLVTAMRLLEDKNLTNLKEWAGEIKKMSGDSLVQNLILKLLQNLTTLAFGSLEERKSLMEKHPMGQRIQSTQYSEVGWDGASTSTSPVGASVPNVSGVALATGQAVFVEDMPSTTNELFMVPVCSTMAHAKLLSVDPSAALSLTGVVTFLSAKDVPEGMNKFKISSMVDEDIFAEDVVMFEGHPIAAVVATSEKVARQAAGLVKVEYEELKPVVSIDDAIKANSYINVDEKSTPKSFVVGDVSKALATSEAVVEGSIQTTRQEHMYEETNNVLVVPVGEEEEYKLYTCSPNLLMIQHTVAMVLGLPFNRIHCTTKRSGCSYGGKMLRFIPMTCATALAARLTGRPVRCHLTRDEDIRIMGQRGEFRGEYKLGVTDGKITGAQYRLYKNAGWNSDGSPDIVTTAMIHLDASYEFPTFHAEGETLWTNTPSNTAFRAYGAPPAMTITENMLYDACVELGLDPLQFRRNNLQRPGYVTHFGQVMEDGDVNMAACMDLVEERCDYQALKQQVEEFNLNNRWRKRGVYLIPNKYGIGLPAAYAQNGAMVHIYLDGSVLISHGGVECGQGLHTKMLQVVATELGIPMDRVRMADSSNDKVPNPIPTGGSSAADLNGPALRDACQQLMERLAPFRAAQEKVPWEMLVQMAFGSRVNLSAVGYYRVPAELNTFDPVSKKGRRWWYYTVGASCSMVEIDVLTGEHTLLSTEIVMDVGTAVNPALDIANIEAAFIQGYGWISMEDTTFSPEGKLLTRGHSEYNMPTIADCPAAFNVTLLKGQGKEQLLYSSKGIGEPPFFNGVSVFFAIKEAVRAARREAHLSGKFQLQMPATPENVLEACATNIAV